MEWGVRQDFSIIDGLLGPQFTDSQIIVRSQGKTGHREPEKSNPPES